MSDGAPDTAHDLAEETRQVNERLVVAGVRMQELADEAEAARRRLAVLAEVSRLLGASFDLAAVLPGVAELLSRELCDGCSIDVASESGSPSCSIHVPAAGPAADALEHARRVTLKLGRALVCAPAPDPRPGEPRTAALLRAGGFASMVSVPVDRRTRARGVLTLLARSRGYEPADVTLAREIAHRIGLAVDRAALHAQALDAVRARDDLLAAVSHDLRNPLNAIVLSSALLSTSDARAGAGKSAYVERIQRSAGHMERLLHDLVDSAKIGAGRFVVDLQPQALGPVVAEVLDLLAPLSERKSLRVDLRLDDGLAGLVVWLDREGILRALTNLVGNAIKFTPEGGSVTVGAERAGDEVRLSVRDTGPGIPPEDLGRLFDRFWQARRTARLGTGLGLFIAREIVEAHRGRLGVESRLGAGSTFTVALPVSPPAPARALPAASISAGRR